MYELRINNFNSMNEIIKQLGTYIILYTQYILDINYIYTIFFMKLTRIGNLNFCNKSVEEFLKTRNIDFNYVVFLVASKSLALPENLKTI